MKTADQWDQQLRRTHYGPEPKRGVPDDAFKSFIQAVQEDARADGFADGFEKGARVARAASALAAGEVPLGNNSAPEVK